jgi:ABC-2 type transport system permease protein
VAAALRIAGKDLKLRIRDRSVLILGIITPLVLAFIFNAVFAPATGNGLNLVYGVVDEDRSDVSAAFVSLLQDAEAEEVLSLDVFETRADADAALASDDVNAFLHIPNGLQQAVFSNQEAVIEVVGGVNAPTSTQIAASFAEQFATGVATSQLAVATTAGVQGITVTPELIGSLTQDPASAAMSFRFVDRTAESRQLDASTFFAAGMSVFFLFFTVQFGVSGLLEEDREGTLPRLLAAPIPRVAIIAGKAIVAFVLGVLAMLVLIVATTFAMGADWGAPPGVAVLVIAGVLSAIGIMGLVASVAKTPEGAGNLGSIIAVALGMLGGTFFPIATSGGLLAVLSNLTPHTWFMRGLGDLSSGAPWIAALPAAGAMMGFAVVTGVVAYFLMRRRLSP